MPVSGSIHAQPAPATTTERLNSANGAAVGVTVTNPPGATIVDAYVPSVGARTIRVRSACVWFPAWSSAVSEKVNTPGDAEHSANTAALTTPSMFDGPKKST